MHQSADEIEVLFTLMAERYECRSMLITSNLVSSALDQIFKNPMTERLRPSTVSSTYSVILEFAVPSYRSDKARKNGDRGQLDEASEVGREVMHGARPRSPAPFPIVARSLRRAH